MFVHVLLMYACKYIRVFVNESLSGSGSLCVCVCVCVFDGME